MRYWALATFLLLGAVVSCSPADPEPAQGATGVVGVGVGGGPVLGVGGSFTGSGGSGGNGLDCLHTFYVDQDGDGLGGSEERTLETCTTFPPPGLSAQGGDCNDADPSAWELIAPDNDGDSYTTPGSEICEALPPIGYAPVRGNDCDDNNPELWQTSHQDNDGDGSGDPEAPGCSGATPGEGYAWLGDDCDDADPNRGPLLGEQWGDDVDSNCDGATDPTCTADDPEAPCPCALQDQLPEADASCASAPDLSVEILTTCPRCGPHSVLARIRNLGGETARGLRLSVDLGLGLSAVEVSAPVQELTHELAPGESLAPVFLPDVWPIVSVSVSTEDDCDGGNDTVQLSAHARSDCR